mmetsp:Transcript_18823/g.65610  ORF Transcript_18823/g.65610 Transcript_18823/m.65610 type:complete len:233 (+) Transcript_18823:1491-2189(+)
MRLVGLTLFDLRQLVLELVQKALEHVDNLSGLELVRGHCRGPVATEAAGLGLLLQQGSEDAGHALDGLSHLLEHRIGLGLVVVLRRQDLNRTRQRIHGLRIVLGHLQELIVLDLAVIRGLLLLSLERADLLVQLADHAAELLDVAVGLGNEGQELINLGGRILDLQGKVLRVIIHPLSILLIGDFLHPHLLRTLILHFRQHVDNLLRWRHSRRHRQGRCRCGEHQSHGGLHW